MERPDSQSVLFESEGAGEASRSPHVRSKRVFRRGVERELFPRDPGDLVPDTCVSRRVAAVVSRLDVSALRLSYDDKGGVAYDPLLMVGVLLLGYALGATSSRELEDRCRYDVRFMYVSQGVRPDYRTLARFRLRLEGAVDGLFSQVLAICREEGILKMERLAVDGTKMESAASQLARWLTKDDLSELERLDLEPVPASDPDAAVVKGAKGFVLGYNAQAAVDPQSGVVAATSVVRSSADQGQLAPMLDRVNALAGSYPEEVVADKGYDSHAELRDAQARGVEAYVPPKDAAPLFWTAVSPTRVVCPMGEEPSATRSSTSGGERTTTHYVPVCPSCRFFGSCCASRSGRSLKVPEGANPALRVIQAHWARSPEGKTAQVERMAAVEPFFARVKWNRRHGRFRLRGLAKVNLEFALLALAENARILGKRLRDVPFPSSGRLPFLRPSP